MELRLWHRGQLGITPGVPSLWPRGPVPHRSSGPKSRPAGLYQPHSPSRPRGELASGPPKLEDKRIKELSNEVARLKKQLSETPPPTSPSDSESDEGPAISDLVEYASQTEKLFGKENHLAQAARQKVAEARAKRDEGKSVSARVREAEKAVERRQRAKEHASNVLDEAKKSLETAQEAFEKAAAELADAEEALRASRATALKEAGGIPDSAALEAIQAHLKDDAAAKETLDKLIKALGEPKREQPSASAPPQGASQEGT